MRTYVRSISRFFRGNLHLAIGLLSEEEFSVLEVEAYLTRTRIENHVRNYYASVELF